MKKNTLYISFALTTLLCSCGEKEIVQTEVEFITVQSQTSIKDDLVKLVEPFECNTIKDKVFVCYPLYLERLDIDNSKSKLNYETNKGVNYDKIAAVKRDFTKFFDNIFSYHTFTIIRENQDVNFFNYFFKSSN